MTLKLYSHPSMVKMTETGDFPQKTTEAIKKPVTFPQRRVATTIICWENRNFPTENREKRLQYVDVAATLKIQFSKVSPNATGPIFTKLFRGHFQMLFG